MPALRCSCGASGSVPESFAGRAVKCPKCGAVIPVPQAASPAAPADRGAYAIAPDAAAASAPRRETGPVGKGISVSAAGSLRSLAPPAEADSERAAAPKREPAFSSARAARELEREKMRERGFARDLLDAVFFFATIRGALMFLALTIVAAGGQASGWLALLSSGLLYAYYFSTIVHAAGGERGIPDFDNWNGVWESVLAPFLQFVGTGLALSVPAIVALFAMPALGASEEAITAVVVGLGAIAAFLWPIALLMVAVGDIGSLVRIDLVARTPLRALPQYLVVVGLVFGTIALRVFLNESILESLTDGQDPGAAPTVGVALASRAIGAVISLYCSIVSMQAIGLYYKHYSDRFPWTAG